MGSDLKPCGMLRGRAVLVRERCPWNVRFASVLAALGVSQHDVVHVQNCSRGLPKLHQRLRVSLPGFGLIPFRRHQVPLHQDDVQCGGHALAQFFVLGVQGLLGVVSGFNAASI